MARREGTRWRVRRLAAAALATTCFAGVLALGADGRLIERTATVTVAPDTDNTSAEARCPKGKKVVLGGLDYSTDEGLTTTHLKRDGKRRWLAGVRNFFDDERTLTSIAYCAKLKGVKARTETVEVGEQDSGDPPATVEARCHRGERLAFGGFDYEVTKANDAYLSDLRRVGKRRWLVGVFNFNDTAPLTAIAYCSKKAQKTSTESETITLQGNEVNEVTARCGRGERVAFGGFSGDVTANEAFVLLRGLARTSARKWAVTAVNENEFFSGELTAFAYCAEK